MSTRPTTDDFAGLSAEAYHTYPRDRWEAGVVVNGTRYEIIDQTSGISGYQGTLFRNTENGTFVVAHRGTEFDRQLVRDGIIADGGMVLTGVNSQKGAANAFTERAIEIANRRNAVDGCEVPAMYVTGHSLGGTLAQISANRYGLQAETFEAYGAAGLVADPPRDNPNIVNHVRATSFVSAASPHIGEVRIYTTQQDVEAMHQHGYANDDRRYTDLRNPPGVAFGIGVDAHYTSNFLAGAPGGSIINMDNLGMTEIYRPMVEKYREDVATIHGTLALPRNAVDGVVDGAVYLGGKIADGARYVFGGEPSPPPPPPPGFDPPHCPAPGAGDGLQREGAVAPATTMPAAASATEERFQRLATTAMSPIAANDPNALAPAREFLESPQGQSWLQQGRDLNQQQAIALAAREAPAPTQELAPPQIEHPQRQATGMAR